MSQRINQFLAVIIILLQGSAFGATANEQACADKSQKQNEMQAMALAEQALEKAEEACPMTKDEACAVRVLKKKQYDILIGNISRNPLMDMDGALKKLKAVSKEYKHAKTICPQ